ncbi:MAG: nuclear transport factor 2 family protein [Saprospiraceae bacterium]|nr:nuclear transport factor 2 family protein [Saprospiraceae bacterium]
MKKQLFFLFFLLPFSMVSAQDEIQIINTIDQMFDGMREADTTKFKTVFHPSARLLSTTDRAGETVYKYETVDNFVKAIATPHDQIWDEKIWSYDIKIDDCLATAWTKYSFFVGEQLSHCGVNTFTLIRTKQGWKITEIADTRRTRGCQTEKLTEQEQDISKQLNKLLDDWHLAAATADEFAYFGVMSPGAIYLGTDASEKWTREEFSQWAKEKKAFDGDTAWDFRAKNREIYFSKNGDIAWFDEELETWMGACRGSGVLENINGEWKLQHYNLAVTIPNELMRDFIKMKFEKRPER